MVASGPGKSLLKLESWQVRGRPRPRFFTYRLDNIINGDVVENCLDWATFALIGPTDESP